MNDTKPWICEIEGCENIRTADTHHCVEHSRGVPQPTTEPKVEEFKRKISDSIIDNVDTIVGLMWDIDRELEESDDDEQLDAFSEGYPFLESFDEQAMRVGHWHDVMIGKDEVDEDLDGHYQLLHNNAVPMLKLLKAVNDPETREKALEDIAKKVETLKSLKY